MLNNLFTPEEIESLRIGKMLNSIKEYIAAGYSIMPVTSEGLPLLKDWEKYQKERMTLDEAQALFRPYTFHIGIICGQISGGLEVIKIDEIIHNKFIQKLCDKLGSKGEAFVTTGFGTSYALMFYRCKINEISKTLVDRTTTKVEKEKIYEIAIRQGMKPTEAKNYSENENKKVQVKLIGEHDYVVVPNTDGYGIGGFAAKEISTKEREIVLTIVDKL